MNVGFRELKPNGFYLPMGLALRIFRVKHRMFINLISGWSAVYGITKSIWAPSRDRARARFKQATPSPPLL